MKRMRKIGIIIALLLPIVMMAQEPRIKVSAKPQVTVGEQFRVAFEVNPEGKAFDDKSFKAPSFDGFTLLGGPMISRNSNIQVINGVSSQSFTQTFSYILRADNEGDFTIGAASGTVGGDVVKSEPYNVKVVAGNNPPVSANQGGQQSTGQNQAGTNNSQVNAQDIFLKVIPSKKSVYVGEPIVLTYKLYTRVPVTSFSVSKMPGFGGFYTKECENRIESSEVVNGVTYSTYEIFKTVAIPQKSGSLPIDPMIVDCVVQIVTQRTPQPSNDPFSIFFNDPFFSRDIANVPKTLQTPALTIESKSLPEQGRPDSFKGAVGNYNFTASADKNELNTNEVFILTLTLSGSGNLELVNLPDPVFPPDFEVYDPKITNSVVVNGQGMNGTKKAEYTVIPRHAGDYTVPAIDFSFFNPSNGRYETLTSSAMNFKVNKGEGGDDSEEGGLYATNQGDVKRLGSDIRHIHTGSSKLKAVNAHFFASSTYYFILVGLLLLFIMALVLTRKRRQFKQDVVLVRNKRATKIAKGRLKNAYKYLKTNDQNHFYEEMSQALWGYISDKLSIERSVLSMETVKGAMMDKGIDETLADEFVETLDTCEFARFAPGDAAAKMQGLYDKGMDVIMKVEKTI